MQSNQQVDSISAPIAKNKNKFRFHLVGLVHLPTSREYMSCAFTQKNIKLATMLMSLGHEVYMYGAKSSDPNEVIECTEFIETHTAEQIANTWGNGDNRFEIGYDWRNADFRHDFNTEKTPLTLMFNEIVIQQINARKQPDDFLIITQGVYQEPIKHGVGLFLNVEAGIGYRGSVASNYRAFESHHMQSFSYGSEHPFEDMNGSYYDRVIPNYFDGEMLRFKEEPGKRTTGYEREDQPLIQGKYALFIGRMIKRKGIITAALAAEKAGIPLVIVGQGAAVNEAGQLVPLDTPDFVLEPGNWTYFGYANAEQRENLMQNAVATFTPTEYLECFAGTHVESMLCGTPVITTDFGVFGGNTFMHGVHGFKCSTLDDFVWSLKQAETLDRYEIRRNGERFLMEQVRWDYQKWFEDLHQVYLSAVDSSVAGWHNVRAEKPDFRNHL